VWGAYWNLPSYAWAFGPPIGMKIGEFQRSGRSCGNSASLSRRVRITPRMRAWRLLLQTIGVLNLGLSVGGCYFLAYAVERELRHPHADPRWPFFGKVFWTQTGINVFFLLAFVFVSVMLLKLRPKAAIAHSCLCFALLLYAVTPGVLWLLPDGVGSSIAAATGVGNMGDRFLGHVSCAVRLSVDLNSVRECCLAQTKSNWGIRKLSYSKLRSGLSPRL
jgi:hypothetical protein